jgi:hypothetical protein
MTSTHDAELPIPMLPLAARMAHIVRALRSHSLVSIGTLCDAGCEVIFTTTTVTVHYNNAIVMKGTRTPPGLWHFVIPVPPTATTTFAHDDVAFSTIGYPQAAELVAYSHAALFSPVLSTLETALQRGYVRNIPGLTAKTLRRHPPRSVATAKGHLDQTRKNARSTNLNQAAQLHPTQRPPTPRAPTRMITALPMLRRHTPATLPSTVWTSLPAASTSIKRENSRALLPAATTMLWFSTTTIRMPSYWNRFEIGKDPLLSRPINACTDGSQTQGCAHGS